MPKAFLFMLTLCVTAATAQIDTQFTDTTIVLKQEAIVTALRMMLSSNRVAESVGTFRRDQLLRLSPMSTPDALSNVAGVWMQKTNHGGGSPFIRGLTGYQTLVLVDGIRFNNSTFRSGPNQYVNTIDPLTLERIEVLRGQGSVQYGSDAIGGVVQFFLREPQFASHGKMVTTGRVYARHQDHDMEYAGRAEAEVATKNFSVLGGIGYKQLGDIKAGGDLGTLQSTGYDERAWDVKAKMRNKNVELTAAWQHLLQKDVPLYHQLVSGSYSLYNFNPQQRDLSYVRLESQHNSKVFSQVKYTVAYINSLEEREKQRPNNAVIRYEADEVHTYHGATEIVSVFSDRWQASSGIEWYHDRIRSSAKDENQTTQQEQAVRGLYPDGTTHSNLAVFSLHNMQWNRFNFSLGSRYNFIQLKVDDPSFGATVIKPDALVGNAGVVYGLHEGFELIASANTGFRAPNVNDVSSLGVADYRYEVPNYSLSAEKSFQYQAGIRWQHRSFKAEVFMYKNQLRDLISNVSSTYNGLDSLDGFKVFKKENVNRAEVKGIEAELNYQPMTWLTAFANITATRGDNKTRQEPLSRIPPVFVRIGTDIKFRKPFTWRVETLGARKQDRLSSGDQQDTRIKTGGTPGWIVANTRLNYVHRNFQVNAGVQNIFDKAYRIHGSGVDGVGRSFWISLVIEITSVHE